jgi:hypothetical protein
MKLWPAAIQLLFFFLGPKLHASTLAYLPYCGVLAHSIAAGLFDRDMPHQLSIHLPYQKLVGLWIISLAHEFGDIEKLPAFGQCWVLQGSHLPSCVTPTTP